MTGRTRRAQPVLFLLSAILLQTAIGACSVAAPLNGSAVPASTAAAGTPRVLPGVQHLFLIIMENRAYSEIAGSSAAPYLNSLAAQFGLATRYFAVAHPSLPNYLALLAGDTLGVRSDCETCFQTAPTLVDEIERSGRSWKAYMEDLPAPCSLVTGSHGYALKHDPFLYFQAIRISPERCGAVVPLTELDADLAANNVPSFAWITPTLTHDTHDSQVATGDSWLRGFVPRILASSAWQQGGLLLITWDEGTDNAACCGDTGGGRVATLAIGPAIRPGSRSSSPANHYSLLRAIEDLWGLAPLGHAAGASDRWLRELLAP